MVREADAELTGSGDMVSVQGLAPRIRAIMLSLDGLNVLLMWGSIILARVISATVEDSQLSNSLVAIAALPLLIILPRQLGSLIWPLAREWQRRLGAMEEYVVAWLAGIWLLVIGLALVTGVAGLPASAAGVAVLIIATMAIAISAFYERGDIRDRKRWRFRTSIAEAWPFAVALAMVAAPLTVIRTSQPYPLQVGWGLFGYNYRIQQFLETDHISIAPGLHTPIHPSLLGVSSVATGADSEGLIWAAPLLLFVAFGIGVFLLARRILGSNLLALGTVWIAVWILSLTTFQHLHAVGMRGVILAMWPWALLVLHMGTPTFGSKHKDLALHILMPFAAIGGVGLIRWFFPGDTQVWALIALIGIFLVIVRSLPDNVRYSVGLFTFLGASFTFIHIIEGPLFFGFGLGFVLLLSWRLDSIPIRVALAAGYLAIVLFIVAQLVGDLAFSDASLVSRILLGNDRANAIPIPFDEKMTLFKKGLSFSIMGLLGLSAVRVLLWPNVKHIAAITMIAVAMFLYFFPESGFHRALGPVIPLIALSIAMEFRWFADGLARLSPLDTRMRVFASGALVIVALIVLTPQLTSSLLTQMALPSRLGIPSSLGEREFSNITQGEYDASVWIRDNTPNDWLLVSDPTTMFFMESLTFHPQLVEKRAWVAVSEYSDEDQVRLAALSPSVFRAPTVFDGLQAIWDLRQDSSDLLLVISYRTLDWFLAPDEPFRLPKPRERVALEADALRSFCGYYSIDECPSRFFSSELLEVIYNSNGVAVLVPKHQVDDLDLS